MILQPTLLGYNQVVTNFSDFGREQRPQDDYEPAKYVADDLGIPYTTFMAHVKAIIDHDPNYPVGAFRWPRQKPREAGHKVRPYRAISIHRTVGVEFLREYFRMYNPRGEA